MKKKNGLDLMVEVMTVVVVLGIVVGLAIPRYMRITTKSKQDEAKETLKKIHVQQGFYWQDYGTFWTTTDTLSAKNTDAFRRIDVWVDEDARYIYFFDWVTSYSYRAVAIAKELDGDSTPDIWVIDQAERLTCLSDDVDNYFEEEARKYW